MSEPIWSRSALINESEAWRCSWFLFCSGVVEYDAEGFTKLTLLLMWKDFCFLVHGRRGTKIISFLLQVASIQLTCCFVFYIRLPILMYLVVDLPLYFPRDQPTLTFQSVYHFTNSGQLYSQVQTSYPYSPRWDGNEMAKRAKYVQFVTQKTGTNISTFQIQVILSNV